MNRVFLIGSFVALAVALGLMAACGEASEENQDDFNSEIACNHYCAKHFDCQDVEPSEEDTDNCISDCRDAIEDQCGNDDQQAANDKIEECVDKACTGTDNFAGCMVFDAAPECFDFVDES